MKFSGIYTRVLMVIMTILVSGGIVGIVPSYGAGLEDVLLKQEYSKVSGPQGTGLAPIKLDPIVLIERIIDYALTFLGLIVVIIILTAGFKWMTARGDDKKVAEAQKTLKYAVVGLVIIISAWAITAEVFTIIHQKILPSSSLGL